MNAPGPNQSPKEFANFSETKRDILKDIRSKWDRFSEEDLGRLHSNDDLITEIAARYGIDRDQAQSDVDTMMNGRQI